MALWFAGVPARAGIKTGSLAAGAAGGRGKLRPRRRSPCAFRSAVAELPADLANRRAAFPALPGGRKHADLRQVPFSAAVADIRRECRGRLGRCGSAARVTGSAGACGVSQALGDGAASSGGACMFRSAALRFAECLGHVDEAVSDLHVAPVRHALGIFERPAGGVEQIDQLGRRGRPSRGSAPWT